MRNFELATLDSLACNQHDVTKSGLNETADKRVEEEEGEELKWRMGRSRGEKRARRRREAEEEKQGGGERRW